MNKVIDKGFRSYRFVSTIVKHPVLYDVQGQDVLPNKVGGFGGQRYKKTVADKVLPLFQKPVWSGSCSFSQGPNMLQNLGWQTFYVACPPKF